MGNLVKVIAALVLLISLSFGYFMSKNSWDPVLTFHVMKYEVTSLLGTQKNTIMNNDLVNDAVSEATVDETEASTESESAETAEAPATPKPTGTLVYKGKGSNGEASFSDIKSHSNNQEHRIQKPN